MSPAPAVVERNTRNAVLTRGVEFMNNKKRTVGEGDFVETVHGVFGIITAIKPDGTAVNIATSDMRTFYCSATELVDCEVDSIGITTEK